MAIEDQRDPVSDYQSRLEAVLMTEAEMGETSALIADMADALSHFPHHVELGADFITIAGNRLDADQWPSFRDLCIGLQSWRKQREVLQRAWLELSAEQQAQVDQLPEMGNSDPTRAWV